jgi:hypothetical protein
MKLAFKSAEQLGKKLLAGLTGCLLAMLFASSAQATQGTYVSPATVTAPPGIPPNVDATNFVNNGVWNILTYGYSPDNFPATPYQTANTLNYLNTGTMNGSIGWEFDHGPKGSISGRGWSANFTNGNGATIYAQDGPIEVTPGVSYTVSYLLISATNIINQGLLQADPYGEMILNGSGVNLSRSGLEITPIAGTGGMNGNPTNFTPDTAVYDQYWMGGTNGPHAFGPAIWNGSTAGSMTFYNVAQSGAPCGAVYVSLSTGQVIPYAVDSYVANIKPSLLTTTNKDLMTTNLYTVYSNIVKQAIFVQVGDPSITPSVRFGPQISPTNYFLPMAAQLLSYSTNLVTDALQPSTIYVEDNLAAVGTNGYLKISTTVNLASPCPTPTFRPDSATVTRLDAAGYYNNGTTGLGEPPADFYYFAGTEVISNAPYLPYTISYSNAVPAGRADLYSALVDNLASEAPSGFAQTNAPGKIKIYAQNLNLSKARVSSATEIDVSATNLVSSAGAIMDCQNLSYNLGSTNGNLNFVNLALPIVQRVHGTANEWSGLWTNYLVSVYPNWVTNSTGASNGPIYLEADITNVTEVDMAITVVDASGLETTIPVTVQNLILHSPNMIVSDFVTVTNAMLFDGSSLTISNNGGIVLAGGITSWTATNAPTLRYFTNYGSLTIPVDAHFGDGGPTNYASFANYGTITTGNEYVNSGIFEGSGSQSVSAGYFLTAASGKIENGSITAGQQVQFAATTLKLNQATITAGDELYFYVTGSLLDAGGSSGNLLTCNNGFDLAVKPATGDLLGTSIETITPVFAGVDHYWSGTNAGPSSVGYTNNEAVGKLILNEGSDSEFLFHATSASNAIYVDLLDLSQCPDFLDPTVLTIDPNFVIYYAAAKLPPTFTIPPNTNGIPQEPEEFLNGQLGGHLVWVSSFAGPNSSVDVLINGQTAQVNKALRYSKIIDSNSNGIPNYYDLNPFNPSLVVSGSVGQTNQVSAKQFAISWTAVPNTVYQVQSSTSFISASWTPLLNYTNSASTNVVVTVWDTNALSGQRFYRVSHP